MPTARALQVLQPPCGAGASNTAEVERDRFVKAVDSLAGDQNFPQFDLSSLFDLVYVRLSVCRCPWLYLCMCVCVCVCVCICTLGICRAAFVLVCVILAGSHACSCLSELLSLTPCPKAKLRLSHASFSFTDERVLFPRWGRPRWPRVVSNLAYGLLRCVRSNDRFR